MSGRRLRPGCPRWTRSRSAICSIGSRNWSSRCGLTRRGRAHAEYLDQLTAAQWLADEVKHPDARTFFPLFIGEMMAADPAAISVLHMAFYLRSGGGIRYLNAFEGGAQQWRIDGGSHLLCEALADRLGERVRLRHPVSAIDQDADEVVVHCVSAVDGTRSEYRADQVVVAIPPLAQRIEFRPALPAPRATAATGRGCAIKVHLSYPAPIWRMAGLVRVVGERARTAAVHGR